MEVPEGAVLTAPVDLGLFLRHPQEPRSSYITVGQGGCRMQDRNRVENWRLLQ